MSFSSFQKATGQKTKRRLGGVRAALGGRKHKIDQAMQDLVTGQGNEYRVIDALEEFYNGLKDGHLYNASRAYRRVSHLPGMFLIKPLFLARFPQQAHLGELVGTQTSTDDSAITQEEIDAIRIYSGGSYIAMNGQLRGHAMRRSKGPLIGASRMDEDAAKAETSARDRGR
jgi:hypothetical protein